MYILQKYKTTPEQTEARANLRSRLAHIVQDSFGDSYDVEDISAHVYARDLSVAPVEFVIVVSSMALTTCLLNMLTTAA